MIDRCHTCDLPLATDADLEGCEDGCQCARCVSLCWIRYGNRCTGERVDWRARALRATDVDAMTRVIDSAQRICHRNQWSGVVTVQRQIAEAIRAHVLGEEFDP